MNKIKLAEVLAEKMHFNKKQAEEVIDNVTDIITATLKSGEEVVLAGFGAFCSRVRKARGGVDPRNPKLKITIPEVIVPKFKAGKNLKEALKKHI